MRDAAGEALSFVEGRSRADLDNDRMLVLSLIAEIQIIGGVQGFQRKPEPQCPLFREMIGMRNRLIHAYFDINLDILWDTANLALVPVLAVFRPAAGLRRSYNVAVIFSRSPHQGTARTYRRSQLHTVFIASKIASPTTGANR